MYTLIILPDPFLFAVPEVGLLSIFSMQFNMENKEILKGQRVLLMAIFK